MAKNTENQEYSGVESTIEKNLLFDYYGQLLNDRQSEIFKFYYEENYSLSEIASELDISKQGVHDALKKAEQALVSFEDKLKLIAKHDEYLKALKKINEILKALHVDEDDYEDSGNDYEDESEIFDAERTRMLIIEMEKIFDDLEI